MATLPITSPKLNSEGTYRYQADPGDFAEDGRTYEKNVTAFVSLKALTNFEDFCLISNPPECQPYDDIILSTKNNSQNITYLFQVKRNAKCAIIYDDEIELEYIAVNNKRKRNLSKFQIDTLFGRYPGAIKNIVKIIPAEFSKTDFKVVIFTNRPIQKDSKILELDATNITFSASKGEVYKFKPDFIARRNADKSFLQSIFIYANQTEDDLITTTPIAHIKGHFNTKDNKVEAIKADFFKCVINWCEIKDEKDSLTKKFIYKLFMYSTFKNFAIPIKTYNKIADEELRKILSEECFALLWESIKDKNLTVSSNHTNYVLGRALEEFEDFKSNSLQYQYEKVRKEYAQIISNDELKQTDMKDQLDYYIGFLLCKLPLIIQDFNLELQEELKNLKIVFIDSKECPKNWSQIGENVRNKIQQIEVTTSSRQKFKVEDIINGISSEASISDVLNLIIDSRNKKDNHNEILIERSLHRVFVDKTIFLEKNQLFIINTNAHRDEFISWSGINEEFFLTVNDYNEISDYLEQENHTKHILINKDVNNIEITTIKDVHFFKFIQVNSLNKRIEIEWIKSNANIRSIKKFRCNNLCQKIQDQINRTYPVRLDYVENCLCCIKVNELFNNQFIIISGVPGAGKTTFLKQIAQTGIIGDFILFIALIDHYVYYDNYKTSTTADEHLLYFYNLMKESAILGEFFANKIKTKNITILFDAFDEIAPKYTESVSEMIQKMRDANYKIILTTRSVLKSKVEDIFGIFAYSLNLFYDKDQTNYITAYHDLNINNLEKDEFLQIVYKNMPRDIEFCKVPVNLKLIADVISDELENKNSNIIVNQLELYDRFIKYRLKIYSEKINNTNITKESILAYHQYFSINLLFKNLPIYEIIQDSLDIKLESHIMELKRGADKVGILIDDIKEIIIHRTVAEFLAAQWLIEFSTLRSSGEILPKHLQNYKKFAEHVINMITFSKKFYNINYDAHINNLEDSSEFDINYASYKINEHNYNNDESFSVIALFIDSMINKNELHKAALDGDFKKIQMQINNQSVCKLNDFNRTVLHTIIFKNTSFYNTFSLKICKDMIEVVKLLITKYKDMVTQPDSFQISVANYSKQKKENKSLLKILIHKADIYFSRNFELWEIFNPENLLNCNIYELLEALQQINKLSTIFEAAKRANLTVIREFSDNGINLDISTKGYILYKHILHFAAESGSLGIVKYLCESGMKEKMNILDRDRRSIAHHSVLSGELELIRYLNENKLNFNTYESSGFSAFHYSIIFDKIEILEYLLAKGHDINFPTRSRTSCLPIQLAAVFRNEDIFECLLKNGADINCEINGHTLLHFCIWGYCYFKPRCTTLETTNVKNTFDFAKLLLKKGLKINAKSRINTPLTYAAFFNYKALTNFLIENSADINSTNDYGCTVFHVAASKHNVEMLKLLIEHEIDINAVDINKNSALHYALNFLNFFAPRRHKTVTFLIENGINPITPNDQGLSPLHFAARGHFEELKLIAEATNFNLNAQNNDGNTALHYAASNNHLKIVEYLIKNHADINLPNNKNQTPLDVAKGYKEIELFLKSHNGISRNTNEHRYKSIDSLEDRFYGNEFSSLGKIVEFYLIKNHKAAIA